MSNALVITPMKSLNIKNLDQKNISPEMFVEKLPLMLKYLKHEMPLAAISSRIGISSWSK